MSEDFRKQMLEAIGSNIAKHGRHIYSVMGGESPRFLYTIGLHEKLEFELILAGALTVPNPLAGQLLNQIAEKLEAGGDPETLSLDFGEFGVFRLGPVDRTWSLKTVFGVMDYYCLVEAKVMQVFPDADHITIDVPDMSVPFDPSAQPVWKWLEKAWPYSVPSTSLAVTNLDALRGLPITEVMRWEELEWEAFSGPGPDVPKEEVFGVPIALLIAFDPSLAPILDLKVETGVHRGFDETGTMVPWHPWLPASAD